MYDDYGMSWAQEQYDRQETPELEAKFHCDFCGNPLYEGETFYEIDNGKMCESCLESFRRFA